MAATIVVAAIGVFVLNFDRNGKTATGAAVIVMDTAMVSSNLKEISADGTLVFNNLAEEDIPVKGDVICSAPSKAAPQGFLYKVKEITTRDNETIIVTEMATIEESVKKASVNQSFNLTVVEFDKVEGVDVQLQEYAAITQKPTMQYAGIFDWFLPLFDIDNAQADKTSTFTIAKLDVDVPLGKIAYKNNIDDVGLIKGSIKGSIELNSTFHCEIDIKDYTLKHLLLTTEPQIKTQLTASIEGLQADTKFHIETFKFAPVTIQTGTIPIVFTPTLSIDVIVSINGGVTLQTTPLVEWDYSYIVGCSYDKGEWTTIGKNTSKPAKYLDDVQFVKNLGGSVKVQPELSYSYDLYDTGLSVGIFGNMYAKLAVESNIGAEQKLSFHCGLEFGTRGDVEIFSKKIGIWKLAVLPVDWLIWEKPWIWEKVYTIAGQVGNGVITLPNSRALEYSVTEYSDAWYLYAPQMHINLNLNYNHKEVIFIRWKALGVVNMKRAGFVYRNYDYLGYYLNKDWYRQSGGVFYQDDIYKNYGIQSFQLIISNNELAIQRAIQNNK
jgi:hypothetical protein